MKVLIDTNVIIDTALRRKPFLVDSDQVLFFAQTERFDGYVSASSITDLYYILRKRIGHLSALIFLRRLVTVCKIASVDQTVIEAALVSDFKDFEDAIQNYTAIAVALDAIVTRNTQDFSQSNLQVLTPGQLLQTISPENQE